MEPPPAAEAAGEQEPVAQSPPADEPAAPAAQEAEEKQPDPHALGGIRRSDPGLAYQREAEEEASDDDEPDGRQTPAEDLRTSDPGPGPGRPEDGSRRPIRTRSSPASSHNKSTGLHLPDIGALTEGLVTRLRTDPNIFNLVKASASSGRDSQPPEGTRKLRESIAERSEEIAELMSNKDSLRTIAEQPFKGSGLKSTLNFEEFKAALVSFVEEIQMTVPSDDKIRQLFDKNATDGKGVGPEEYEALLFRLLCFMRAKDLYEPDLRTSQRKDSGPAERDERWREEFIRRNPRRFDEVYERQRVLGNGTFGTVYMVAHRAQPSGKDKRRIRVCKIISKTTAENAGTKLSKVREELAVLKQLDHPHVLRIFEDFEDDDNFYLVMEPCYGGTLQEYMKQLPPMDAKRYEFWVAKVMQHTLAAIAYCHGKGVIHKDLKPENVMMSTERSVPVEDMHIVVVDFGLAEVFSSPTDRSNIISGTPPYMAPEVWRGSFTKSCDIWSCGVMLFFLLSGRLPFVASRIEDFPRAVAQNPDWKLMGGASDEAKEFCQKMLTFREDHRPFAHDALKHPWFVRNGLAGHGGVDTHTPLPRKQVNNLMQVTEKTEFEKFLTRLVATQVDASSQKQVNEAFHALDTDNDGLLSEDELREGLMRMGASSEQISHIVDELDVGHTGRISYTEFMAGSISLRSKSKTEQERLLWVAWQQFSPDANGKVKISSLEAALATRGMTVADIPTKLLDVLRRDSKGEIDFNGFKKLFSEEQGSVMSSILGAKDRLAKEVKKVVKEVKKAVGE